MKERLINKQPIRTWDPLFAALFEHADKIDLKISSTEKGVKVVETSTDPYVAQIIQSHAQEISNFVKEGMAGMHRRHEAPGAKPEANSFLGMGDGAATCPVSGEPISKEFSAEIYGRAVYFCCANCRDAAKKNPALYLKKP
jgi:YHS domain-containing protein